MELRLKKHGPKEVEIGLRYQLAPSRRRRWLSCDVYLFTPAKLSRDVTPEAALATINRYNFYQGYRMGWEELLDATNELSPLTRLQTFSRWESLPETRVVFELKNLTNQVSQLIRLDRQPFADNAEQFASRSLSRYGELEQMQHTVDELVQVFRHRGSQALSHHLVWALEDLSYLVERFLLQSLWLLKKRYQCEHAELTEKVEQQRRYREDHGFYQLNDQRENNESYLYRLHELKKWRSSAFYLTVSRSGRLTMIHEFLLIGATALAMAIFLIFSLMGLHLAEWSVGWVLVLWVGYVLRDRLKEWAGRSFRRSVSSIVGHLFHFIVDPRSGRKCGKIREYVRYPSLSDLPGDIRDLRQLNKDSFSGRGTHERIFHYHEKMMFNSRRFLSLHRRLSGAGQVLRLNLSRYFDHLDCADKNLWTLRSGDLQRLQVPRRYHFNVLIRVKNDLGQTILARYRLLIRHDSLDRVESVYPVEEEGVERPPDGQALKDTTAYPVVHA